MQRSIVPSGFETTAHPVFLAFVPPLSCEQICSPTSSETTEEHLHSSTHISESLVEDTYTLCAICLEQTADHVTIVTCQHSFCYPCIISWFKVRVLCPVCKQGGGYFLHGQVDDHGTQSVKLFCVEGHSQLKPTKREILAAQEIHMSKSNSASSAEEKRPWKKKRTK
jgi:hypothetical protein